GRLFRSLTLFHWDFLLSGRLTSRFPNLTRLDLIPAASSSFPTPNTSHPSVLFTHPLLSFSLPYHHALLLRQFAAASPSCRRPRPPGIGLLPQSSQPLRVWAHRTGVAECGRGVPHPPAPGASQMQRQPPPRDRRLPGTCKRLVFFTPEGKGFVSQLEL
ncbi:hypothetical protein Tsubulata_050585, partial [Turnera subulata]